MAEGALFAAGYWEALQLLAQQPQLSALQGLQGMLPTLAEQGQLLVLACALSQVCNILSYATADTHCVLDHACETSVTSQQSTMHRSGIIAGLVWKNSRKAEQQQVHQCMLVRRPGTSRLDTLE